jgi:hypothetical protein
MDALAFPAVAAPMVGAPGVVTVTVVVDPLDELPPPPQAPRVNPSAITPITSLKARR